jgi:biotin synthase
MEEKIKEIAESILNGRLIERCEIGYLVSLKDDCLEDLMYWANKIREKHFGRKVKICSIVPGRLGGCSEDCKFCAQSSHYQTAVGPAKYLNDDEILAAAKSAKENGVKNFGIVYSGRTISEKELARLEKLIPKIKNEIGIDVCGGFGIINFEQAKRLADAGLRSRAWARSSGVFPARAPVDIWRTIGQPVASMALMISAKRSRRWVGLPSASRAWMWHTDAPAA